MRQITFIIIFAILVFGTMATGDRLPGEVPENQVWTTTSLIEGVGITTEQTSLYWHVSDASLDALPIPRFDDGVYRSGSIAYASYRDSIMSNGGQISEVKTFSLDTHGKTEGLYNTRTEKVLTYTSQNGSHLLGEESYVLDVIGDWSMDESDIICVFSRAERDIIPAFCNKVTASSRLRSMTTAQVQSIGQATVIGTSPAVLNYEISITPDSNSVSGYAEGIVSTTFTVSVMEGRTDGWGDSLLASGAWRPWQSGTQTGWGWSGFRSGVTQIQLVKGGFGTGDYVGVEYNGDFYIAAATPGFSPGPVPLTYGTTSLPDAAQLTIIAEAGSTYILTFEGSEYIINAVDSDQTTAIIMTHLASSNELAARLTTVDTATVSGGISSFMKAFRYQSGIDCENC